MISSGQTDVGSFYLEDKLFSVNRGSIRILFVSRPASRPPHPLRERVTDDVWD
jgi:hypothetical protein